MVAKHEFGSTERLGINHGTVADHLMYPTDHFVSLLDKEATLAMTGGISVLDDTSKDDDYSIRSILRQMQEVDYQTQSGVSSRNLYQRHVNIQIPEYREKLESSRLTYSTGVPQEAIVVVPVLAYSEADHIRHYLSEYASQHVDHSKTTLFIFLNDDGDESHSSGREESIRCIEKYMESNPELNIVYKYLPVPEFIGQLGKVRRFGIDIAYSSHIEQFPDSPDPLIINTDVDVVSLLPGYIQKHIDYHTNRPKVDVTTQTLEFDGFRDMSIPLLTVVARVYSYIHKVLLRNAGISTVAGTDFAIKPEPWYQVVDSIMIHNRGEDIVIGAAMNALRGGFDTVVKIVSQEPGLVSSARRIVEAFSAGSLERMQSTEYEPYAEADDRQERRLARTLSQEDRLMTANFTAEDLHAELMRTFMKFHHKYPTLSPKLYQEALAYIGVCGEFDGDVLTINNTDKLFDGIAKAKKVLETQKVFK